MTTKYDIGGSDYMALCSACVGRFWITKCIRDLLWAGLFLGGFSALAYSNARRFISSDPSTYYAYLVLSIGLLVGLIAVLIYGIRNKRNGGEGLAIEIKMQSLKETVSGRQMNIGALSTGWTNNLLGINGASKKTAPLTQSQGGCCLEDTCEVNVGRGRYRREFGYVTRLELKRTPVNSRRG